MSNALPSIEEAMEAMDMLIGHFGYVTGEWADLFIKVSQGLISKEEAFDEYNHVLLPVGMLFLRLCSVTPDVEKLTQRATEANNRFRQETGLV